MLKCRSLICAQNILVDSSSQKVSAINIIENTLSHIFPILVPVMVFMSFEKEIEDQEPSLFIETKLNDVVLSKGPVNIHFTTTSKNARAIVTLGFIPISYPGILTISILNNNEKVISVDYPFENLVKATNV